MTAERVLTGCANDVDKRLAPGWIWIGELLCGHSSGVVLQFLYPMEFAEFFLVGTHPVAHRLAEQHRQLLQIEDCIAIAADDHAFVPESANRDQPGPA